MDDSERDELLIRIDTRTSATHKWTQDQEIRIRSLEGSRSFTAGVGAVLVMAWAWLSKQIAFGD